MWWNGPGGGPMYGWWIMPVFGIVFLLVVLLIVSRFFGSGSGFCGRPRTGRLTEDDEIKELRKEIRELRDEIRELKKEKL